MLNYIQSVLSQWIGERGQALGEFTLVLAFIALVCVAALGAIGVAVLLPYGNFLSGIGGGS